MYGKWGDNLMFIVIFFLFYSPYLPFLVLFTKEGCQGIRIKLPNIKPHSTHKFICCDKKLYVVLQGNDYYYNY